MSLTEEPRVILVTFNEGSQYVTFHVEPTFYENYGRAAYGYYSDLNKDRNPQRGHFGTIYLPANEKRHILEGTVAYETGRLVIDWHLAQFKVITPKHEDSMVKMLGAIVQAFWKEYDRAQA